MNLLAVDIGGANLKGAMATVDGDGQVRRLRARSLAFELWRAPAALPRRLADLVASLRCPEGRGFDVLAVTMTAELCDCFADRREGVRQVLDHVERFAGGRPVRVWLTEGRFVSTREARRRWLACASANWHALATWIARRYRRGASLLIDIGSTTTDITLLREGKAAVSPPAADGAGSAVPKGQCERPGPHDAFGRHRPFGKHDPFGVVLPPADVPSRGAAERCGEVPTDASRLARGELVYLGVWRTPLMAIPLARGKGEHAATMAERFATAADLFVLTGDQPAQPRCVDTADGRPLTRRHCAIRVLRMAGGDGSIAGGQAVAQATALAREYVAAMEGIIAEGVRRVVQRGMGVKGGGPLKRVIVAGSGEFLAQRVAQRVLPGVAVISLREVMGQQASTAACSVALAYLHGAQPLWSDESWGRVRQGKARRRHR
jgi:uncharacterized hydantoinase/oxoprolinase family protein